MTEKEQDFWTELRFSISSTEIFGAYCDWIEPESYYLNLPSATIEGKVGFLTPEMKVFKFKLTIPYQIDNLTESEWINLTQLELDTDNLDLIGDTFEVNLVER